MTKRQLPRWSELRPLMRPQPVRLSPTRRRLERCQTIWDLRAAARRQAPQPVFDYTDGAAEAEISLRRARRLFRDLEFRPSVLHDVSKVDTTATMLGAESAFPFAFAPTGFTRLMHHEGECAVARVAQRRGIPYGLSTLGTTSIEDVAAAAPAGTNGSSSTSTGTGQPERTSPPGPRRPASTRCWWRLTRRSPVPGSRTSATASRFPRPLR